MKTAYQTVKELIKIDKENDGKLHNGQSYVEYIGELNEKLYCPIGKEAIDNAQNVKLQIEYPAYRAIYIGFYEIFYKGIENILEKYEDNETELYKELKQYLKVPIELIESVE